MVLDKKPLQNRRDDAFGQLYSSGAAQTVCGGKIIGRSASGIYVSHSSVFGGYHVSDESDTSISF